MKSSFLIYLDYKEQFELLSDEELGKLLRAIMLYEETGEITELSGMLKMAFSFIKTQLDKDRQKYEEMCEKNRENAKKGGRPKKPLVSDEKTIGFETKNHRFSSEKPNVNDNVNVNDNDNDNEHDNDNGFGCGRYKCDDEFNIWKRLTPEDIDVLYEQFPNSGGLLIDKVYEEVKAKKVKVKSGLKYILGYAKNVGWDDNADHFDGGGLS